MPIFSTNNRQGGLSIFLRLLLDEGGADIRARAKVGHEPLHVACLGNWGEVVKFLVTKGADPETIDKNGKRCIHLAVEGNRVEAIRELLNQRKVIDYAGL